MVNESDTERETSSLLTHSIHAHTPTHTHTHTRRDAYSGGMNNVYFVGEDGWTQVHRGDTTDYFYKCYPVAPRIAREGDEAMEVEAHNTLEA